MKKLLGVFLAAALLIGIFATIPMTGRAASEMKASEDCIAIIKEFEGFSATPYVDSDGGYTIGYGTRCTNEEAEIYKVTPMTEEQADAALRAEMVNYETDVNRFIDKHGLTYTQGQFDAVVSLVFNIGGSWLNKGATLVKALAGGAQGNELIYALSIYSMSGGSRSVGHVRRRLAEANMYLNGEYKRTPPANFGYVLYKGGIGKVSTYDVQGYDITLTATPIPTASCEGYLFAGWFTAPTGGEKVTVLNESTKNITLYAQYEVDPNYVPPTPPTPSEPTVPDVGTTPSVPTEPDQGTTPSEPNVPAEPQIPDGTPIQALEVTVTGDVVNLRKGPGLSYDVAGSTVEGKKLTITATYESDDYLWGKYGTGWICLQHTNYFTLIAKPEDKPEEKPETTPDTKPEPKPEETPEPKPETKPEVKPEQKPVTVTKTYGTVIKTSTLNIRTVPDGKVVGVLYKGTKVEILEQKMVAGRLWGRCSKGWICMRSYIKLETVTETVTPSQPETKPEVKPEQKPVTVTKTYGTIINTNSQNVRKTPDGALVGKLYRGDKVEILEQKVVAGRLWGRCELGWVCMRSYVKLETVTETVGGTTTPETKPEAMPETKPETEPETKPENSTTTVTKTYGTIINTNFQNVRKTPDGAVVGKLYRGDKVEILEQKMVAGRLWGLCEKGWICMRSYVKLETVKETITIPSAPSEPTTQTGKITASCLNIRAGTGTNTAVVGQLYRGATVVILDKKTVGDTTWARIDKGWISMSYVSVN